MATGCPNLVEIDLSGDSWVKRVAFLGLSNHPKLKILRLGHFEHADSDCDSKLKEFPPKGLYI
jgi:F-box/leucine-rich repeat protein 2/20